MTFQNGSQAYIVESNRFVRRVTVVRRNGNFYMVRFDNNGGIQVRGSRLYATKEDAEASLPKAKIVEQRSGFRSPYDYWH